MLISSKILAQRSAIPAVFSRASERPHTKISHEEKGRLLRMGKRKVKGPFNAIVDPGKLGAGSAMLEPTEAVKKSGTYNVWGATTGAAHDTIKGKGKYRDPEEFLLPLVSRPTIKVRSYPYFDIDISSINSGARYLSSSSCHRVTRCCAAPSRHFV